MVPKSLGWILGNAFEWESSPEGQEYWYKLIDAWDNIKSNELAKLFDSDLLIEGEPDKCWPLYKNTPAYQKFRKLANYRDRFGQDAPIDLMIELVKENGAN